VTILTGSTIRERVVVTPQPTDEQYQPASLDVRLDDVVYDCEEDTYYEQDRFTFEPFKRYLAQTKECIQLPTDVAAQLAGRSTVGRMGIVIHKTAGWIDPGFTGTITLEIMNLSTEPITIDANTRIGQLVCMELNEDTAGYDGQYNDQQRPEPAGKL